MQGPTVSLQPRRVTLPDGSTGVTRPITPGDGPALTLGLERLSPEGNAYRFLHHRKRFTSEELHYLTHCDFADHIALVFATVDPDGRETDAVGVARCVRSKTNPAVAEVAIVFVDEWQRRGAGSALLRHLADLSRQAGMSHWLALIRESNTAAFRLFSKVGREIRRARPGFGLTEITYSLHPCQR